jgi:cytochrome c oxidase assembly protein Cox11
MKQCYERKNPLKICISIYIYIYIYIFKVVYSTVPIYEKTYSIKKYNGV